MKVATLNKHFHPYFKRNLFRKSFEFFSFFFLSFSTFICCAHELFIYRDYWAAVNRNSMCRSIDFAMWKIFDFAHLIEKNTAELRNEVEESRAKQMFFNLFDNFSKNHGTKWWKIIYGMFTFKSKAKLNAEVFMQRKYLSFFHLFCCWRRSFRTSFLLCPFSWICRENFSFRI